MAEDYSLFGKIFVAGLILVIPLLIIYSYDPIATKLGICNENICIPEGVDVINSCNITDDTKVCAYDLNSKVHKITLEETDNYWRIRGTQVVCIDRDGLYGERKCFDVVDFNKKIWQWTMQMEKGGKDIRIFTVIGDKTLKQQERSVFGS